MRMVKLLMASAGLVSLIAAGASGRRGGRPHGQAFRHAFRDGGPQRMGARIQRPG